MTFVGNYLISLVLSVNDASEVGLGYIGGQSAYCGLLRLVFVNTIIIE